MSSVVALFAVGLVVVVNASLSGLYIDNGVDQTVMHRVMSRHERREVQHEILTLLGLHARPRPLPGGRENSAPKFLLDVYKSVLNRNFHSEFNISGSDRNAIDESDVIMSFVNHGHHLASLRHEKEKMFWFDVSEVPAGETIVGAELRLYKIHEPNSSDTNYTVTVYQLIQGHTGEKELQFSDSVEMTSGQEGWLLLNVTGPVVSWVAFPDSNLGLYVSIKPAGEDREVHPEECGIVGSKGDEEKQPFMVAFFKSPGQRDIHVRNTRATRRRKKAESSNVEDYAWSPHAEISSHRTSRSCQKQTLYVSFQDLEWQDWIIAPDGYHADYCSGECSFPLNAHMNATNHAIVQTLVHLMNPLNIPKPCCAPTKLSPISVLYFLDESNVMLRKYKNMVVKSCGCH